MVNSMFIEPVTDDEIHKIVISLNKSAPGYDGVNAQVLELCILDIRQLLCYLCNRSLIEGIFPCEMKIANVLPLYKSGDPMLFNNYRPVSLLCILSKVFEKVMYSRLLNFLNDYKVLISNQFGFRKFHSSYMALMVMMNELTNALDNGDHVIGIFLDFSKAFDTVNHSILLDKLYHYGIRDNALEWFSSYLTGRKQFVTYNGISSGQKTVKCGVPQGSILGPLLFLLYINDLYHVCNNLIPILFADDTNLFFSGSDPKELESEINTELDHISTWLRVNKLSLNVQKTHFVVFSRKKNYKCDVTLRVENQVIEEVPETKFLGVIIDNKLTWKSHIQNTVKKISKGVGIIIKARHYLNKNALITLYHSFIFQYMTYCNHIWGCSAASNLNRIVVLQKKIIRVICRMKPRDSCESKYSELCMMIFLDINVYMISKFMFRVCKSEVPSIFGTYFQANSEVHSHFTRQCNYFHLPVVKSNRAKTNIRYRGAVIWNRILSCGIDPDISEAVFVKLLKQIIVNGVLNM